MRPPEGGPHIRQSRADLSGKLIIPTLRAFCKPWIGALDRERRAVWKARLKIHRRAGRITADQCEVAEALLRRLGSNGRCDPSHATLADDSGESINTVKRAMKALANCGMLGWVRRLVRAGQRVVQTSNAYVLTLGEPPKIPANRCEAQSGRAIRPERTKRPFWYA